MGQPGSPVPPAPAAQRPSRRRLWITLGVLGGVVYIALQALSGAALFYLSNPLPTQNKAPAAPSGWHIATPPVQATYYSYAVSLDTPGLILACGVTHSTSLTSFGKWNAQLWRTDDGGGNWRALQAPFLKGNNECEITAISGRQTTFFAYGQRLASSASTTIWVTHDSGATWTQAFMAQTDYPYYKSMRELSSSVLRDGVLYGLHGDYAHEMFSSSTDDGATWTPIARTSTSDTPDGEIESLIADYAQPHAWYAVVRSATSPLALEHSADEGKTWTVVKQFPEGVGAAPTDLAIASVQPNPICAYNYLYDSSATGALAVGDTTMFSSADGGKTWRQAQLPVRDGDVSGSVRAGPDGCYLAFEENAKGGAFGTTHNVSIWRLASDSSSPEHVAYLKNYSLGFSRDAGVSYVAAANGMEARLIVTATRQPRSWLDFFGGNARNLTTTQLLWTPAT
jgi:photosystem II stability/assembly factor-like uncharacterized protein